MRRLHLQARHGPDRWPGKTTECCGHPTCSRWPDFRGLLRRKVRLERRGFVGPVIASAEASTSPLRDVSHPRAPRCSSPIRASQRAPAPKDAPGASPAPARARDLQQFALSTARVQTGSVRRGLRVAVVRSQSRGPDLPSTKQTERSATGDPRGPPGDVSDPVRFDRAPSTPLR